MNEQELLPCPFCKSEEVLVKRACYNGPNDWYHATCKCGAQGPDMSTYEEAIVKWNCRPESQNLTSRQSRAADA